MTRILRQFFILSVVVLLGAGCRLAGAVFPQHDQVLVYPLATDITYLRAVEALESLDGWVLSETEKERGLIHARNVDFSRFGDADRRNIAVYVKRIGRRETSVELFQESKQVIGGDKVLDRIDYFLSLEVEKDALIRKAREQKQ